MRNLILSAALVSASLFGMTAQAAEPLEAGKQYVELSSAVPVAVPVAVSVAVRVSVAVSVSVGVGVIGMADNVLRPLLLSGRTEMHGLLVFISLLGGMAAFGFIGLVIGPVAVAALGTLLLRKCRVALRQAHRAEQYGVDVPASRIIVTSGASGASSSVLTATMAWAWSRMRRERRTSSRAALRGGVSWTAGTAASPLGGPEPSGVPPCPLCDRSTRLSSCRPANFTRLLVIGPLVGFM
mgnify:CR=1 FL=1